MSKRPLACALLIGAAVLFCGRSVPAADPDLSLVPEGALGFVVVNNLKATGDKLDKLAGQFTEAAPPALATFKARLGVEEGEGFDDAGTFLLVLLPGEDKPEPLLVLPTEDYEELIDQLGGDASEEITEVTVAAQSLLAAKKGDHAVMVNSDARKTLEGVLSATGKKPGVVASLESWVGKNDATLVVLPAGISLLTQKGIEGLKETRKTLADVAAQSPQAGQLMQALDMYDRFFKAVRSECQSAAMGLRIDEAGNLDLGGRLLFTPGGKVAALTAGGAPAVEHPLSDVPDGPFVFCGTMAWSPAWGESLMQWSMNMAKLGGSMYGLQDLSEGDLKKLTEASAATMKNLQAASFHMAPGEAGSPMYSDLYYVMRMSDTSTFLDDYEKYVTTWNEAVKGSEKSAAMKFEMEKADIDGSKALKLSMDVGAMVAQQAGGDPQTKQMMQQMMAMMFGPNGKMTMYMVVVDEKTAVMAVGSDKQTEEMVKSLRKGGSRLGDNQQIAKAAALLPADAIGVGYVSPSGAIAWFKRTIGSIAPLPGIQQLPEFPSTPPLGFSARVSSGVLETELVVPTETIKGLSEYVTSLGE